MGKKNIHIQGSGRAYLLRLIRDKKNFSWHFSGTSERLEYGDYNIFMNVSKWKNKIFALGKEIEKQVEAAPEPDTKPKNIKYHFFKPPAKTLENYDSQKNEWLYTNISGVDLSAAYHQAAHNLGFIDEDTLKRCLNSDKETRLKAWGSIAKKKTIYTFESGEVKEVKTDESPNRPYFFASADYVGEVMHEAGQAIGHNYLFHWVDCIFFENYNKAAQQVEQVFDLYNLPYHYEKIEYLKITEQKNHYKVEKKETGKSAKIFRFAKYGVEEYEFLNF